MAAILLQTMFGVTAGTDAFTQSALISTQPTATASRMLEPQIVERERRCADQSSTSAGVHLPRPPAGPPGVRALVHVESLLVASRWCCAGPPPATALYYPTLGVLLLLALATLYKLALPRTLPWHSGLPGAAPAMLIFLLSSAGLRFYLASVIETGFTYGALATPIAFLLFAFFLGLAVIGGAYFNSAIEELWPAAPARTHADTETRSQSKQADQPVPDDVATRTDRRSPVRVAPAKAPAPEAVSEEPAVGKENDCGEAIPPGPDTFTSSERLPRRKPS